MSLPSYITPDEKHREKLRLARKHKQHLYYLARKEKKEKTL